MKKLFIICNLTLSVVWATPLCVGQRSFQAIPVQVSDLLEKPVLSYEVCDNRIGNVLATLASQYKIPIGVEVQMEKYDVEPQNAVCVTVKNGTVRGVLQAVTSLFPNYEWRELNGTINIVYKNADKARDQLLDTVINHLEVSQATIDDVKSAILQKPEIQGSLAVSRYEVHEPMLLPVQGYENERRYSFTLNNKSVREVLNHIISSTDKRYWSLIRWGEYKNKQYLWLVVW